MMAVSSYKLENDDKKNNVKKGEINLWKMCVKNACFLSDVKKMHFKHVKKMRKIVEKNRKSHCLILFLIQIKLNLHSLRIYWHESSKMNICLCGILMFKFKYSII